MAAAWLGRLDRAHELVDAMARPQDRAAALKAIETGKPAGASQAPPEAGDVALLRLDETLARAEAIQPTGTELAARLQLARTLAEHGAKDVAAALVTDLRSRADVIGRPWQRRRRRARSCGLGGDARQLAAARVAVATAAAALEGLGDHASAIDAYVCSRDAPGISYREWGATIAAAVVVGRLSEASEHAEELLAKDRAARDPERVARLSAEAAVALAALGDQARVVPACEAACDAATAAVSDRWRAYVLGRAARALAVAGEPERALACWACVLADRLGSEFFFECLELGMPAVAATAGRGGLERLAQDIGEIDAWWPLADDDDRRPRTGP